MEPRTEIPPPRLLPHPRRRKPPYIYSDEEIGRLLRRTQQLPSRKGLRWLTFATLFGLLVATGMRVNEALSLDQSDVDYDHRILHVRRTKFGKSRYVAAHPSTIDALKKYAEARGRLFPKSPTPAFFVTERGSRITGNTARYTFAKVSQQLGLRVPAKYHGRGPRLHDLRQHAGSRIMPNVLQIHRLEGLGLCSHSA